MGTGQGGNHLRVLGPVDGDRSGEWPTASPDLLVPSLSLSAAGETAPGNGPFGRVTFFGPYNS
ncbi:hypothetical protein [Streptomyces sp. NBC_01320]|uniref:hypothetical protein n=1 Tax=Streptomyces sp. NBC_01320 TaxID=2903824 RepID=UPI002E0FB025|nr:hypothetical protein OG395_23335 [Streptomyces sp. NBC_01320]